MLHLLLVLILEGLGVVVGLLQVILQTVQIAPRPHKLSLVGLRRLDRPSLK